MTSVRDEYWKKETFGMASLNQSLREIETMDIKCCNRMYASRAEMETEEMMVKRRNTRLPPRPRFLTRRSEKIQVNHEDSADCERKKSRKREM